MSDLADFQAAHGRQWLEIVRHPAFAAALSLANREKLKTIAAYSPEDIKLKGDVILADLVGFLTYESGLLGLHEPKSSFFDELGEPEYPNPIQEAREELILNADEAGVPPNFSPSAYFPPPPPPLKKKTVPKKSGKRKIKKQ